MTPDPLLGYLLAKRFSIRRIVADEVLGRVYEATDTSTGGPVHVKVLGQQFVDHSDAFSRFGREMVANAAIDHQNVLRMLDFGEQHRFFFLVREAVAGTPVSEVIARGGPLPPLRAAHIAAQVASALHAAHRVGIVHRNLGPVNILLLHDSDGDFVKVRDFGLSKLVGELGETASLTVEGSRIGDVATMAPEYVHVAKVGPSVDQYALGVVLFEMVTGKKPFVGPSTQVMAMHLNVPAPRIRDLVPSAPDWLDRIVARCLEKAPESRYSDCGELVVALEQGAGRPLGPPHRTPGLSRPAVQPEPSAAPEPRPMSELLGKAAAAGFASAAILVLLVLLIRRFSS